MTETDRARVVGINHVALEVGDVDTALEWYGQLFGFELRSRSATAAFIDMGDQFIAMSETDAAAESSDATRHFGLVVDDLEVLEERLSELDVERLPTSGYDIRDPWGNRIQIVEYADIQFTKGEHVLDEMDIAAEDRQKTDSALAELADKNMAPE